MVEERWPPALCWRHHFAPSEILEAAPLDYAFATPQGVHTADFHHIRAHHDSSLADNLRTNIQLCRSAPQLLLCHDLRRAIATVRLEKRLKRTRIYMRRLFRCHDELYAKMTSTWRWGNTGHTSMKTANQKHLRQSTITIFRREL